MRDRPQGEVGAQPDRKPAAALGDFSVSSIFRDSQYSNPREVWRRTGDSNSENHVWVRGCSQTGKDYRAPLATIPGPGPDVCSAILPDCDRCWPIVLAQ